MVLGEYSDRYDLGIQDFNTYFEPGTSKVLKRYSLNIFGTSVVRTLQKIVLRLSAHRCIVHYK